MDMPKMYAEPPLGATKFVYEIRDLMSRSYGYLHVCDTDDVAVRQFKDALSDPQGVFFRHPEDYVLVRCGSVNLSSGVVTGESPVDIKFGKDCVEVKK